MICSRCGLQNKGAALFCENCGARLVAPPRVGANARFPAERTAPNAHMAPARPPEKPVETWAVILLVEIAVSLLAAFFLYQNFSRLFSASKTGERYFAAAMSKDWEGAFALLEVEESEFINAEAYANVNKGKEAPAISVYSVQEQVDVSRGFLGKEILITYRAQGDSHDSSYAISLNRQKQKKLLLFDDWKVSTEGLISKEFSVQAPMGAKVTVDGIDLPSSYLRGTEDGHDSYVIPALFSGRHEVKVSMEGMEPVTDSFDSAYDSEYALHEMRAPKEAMQAALQTAGIAIKEIYSAALHGKKYDAVASLFSSNAAPDVKEGYQELVEQMQPDEGSRIEAIAFDSINGTAESYMEDGQVLIEAHLTFDYVLTYTYESYWDSSKDTDTYEDSDSVTFYFVRENGDWALRNLGCHRLYY